MPAIKEDRIYVRTSPDQKAVVQAAAELAGITLSSFMLQCALREAQHVLADHQTLVLSEQASLALAQALLDPPPPNAALRAAFDTYRQRVEP